MDRKPVMKPRMIDLSAIDVNKRNPRGINIQEEDRKLGMLKDSIHAFGILVPLVVCARGKRYKLIDGERRYWAAASLRLGRVPAYVIEDTLSDEDILVRMFHIHHNLEQWDPIPQCHALEPYYQRIAKQENIRAIHDSGKQLKKIAEVLSKETGIDKGLAEDRVYFLRWPTDIKQPLYAKYGEEYFYICGIEEHIIIPALRNYPEYFREVPVDDVRRFLFKKLETRAVGKKIEVREAGPLVKFVANKQADRKKVLKIFDDLVKDNKMTFQEAGDAFGRQFPDAAVRTSTTPQKLYNSMFALINLIDAFDIDITHQARRRTKIGKREIRAILTKLVDALHQLEQRLR